MRAVAEGIIRAATALYVYNDYSKMDGGDFGVR